jgi:hypothetical protein
MSVPSDPAQYSHNQVQAAATDSMHYAPSGHIPLTGHPRTEVNVAQLVPAISAVFLFCSHEGIIQYNSSLAWHVLCSSVPSLKQHPVRHTSYQRCSCGCSRVPINASDGAGVTGASAELVKARYLLRWRAAQEAVCRGGGAGSPAACLSRSRWARGASAGRGRTACRRTACGESG